MIFDQYLASTQSLLDCHMSSTVEWRL